MCLFLSTFYCVFSKFNSRKIESVRESYSKRGINNFIQIPTKQNNKANNLTHASIIIFQVFNKFQAQHRILSTGFHIKSFEHETQNFLTAYILLFAGNNLIIINIPKDMLIIKGLLIIQLLMFSFRLFISDQNQVINMKQKQTAEKRKQSIPSVSNLS